MERKYGQGGVLMDKLRVEGLTKIYKPGNFLAVDNISFNVKKRILLSVRSLRMW